MVELSGPRIIMLMRLAPSQFQAARRRGRIVQWLGVALAWVLLGGAIFLLVRDPLALLQTFGPSMGDAIVAAATLIGTMLFVPVVLVISVFMLLPPKHQWIGSRTLRALVLRGESEQLPAAADQPAPLAADELPMDVKPFRRLKWLADTSGFLPMVLGVMYLGLLMWATVSIADPQIATLRDFLDMAQVVAFVVTLGRLMTFNGGSHPILNGWRTLLPSRRAKLLAIDDFGIRWRPQGWRTREQTLAWHDIVAFCVYHLKTSSSNSAFSVYLLMGNDLSFAWVQSQRRRRAAREASILLSRLAVTRTRLPLLDISKSIETLDTWSEAPVSPTAFDRRQRLIAQLESTWGRKHTSQQSDVKGQPWFADLLTRSEAADAMAAIHQRTLEEAAHTSNPLRPIRMRARFYWLNLLLMLLLATGVSATWQLNQRDLADYYQGLPDRIAAGTLLYRDALTAPDNAWTVQKPTATDTSSYQYAHGGYAMTGGQAGYTDETTLDVRYADVAVMVTTRQIGSAHNDGVGVVARSFAPNGSDEDAIYFYVSPTDGSWTLYHYQPGHKNPDDNWRYLDGGDSAAIHRGSNATNRLLLVLRGKEYLCYINGQFIARDADSTVTPSSPRVGYAGLFVNDDTTTGVFNDFAVYAAPPPYQPLFHGL